MDMFLQSERTYKYKKGRLVSIMMLIIFFGFLVMNLSSALTSEDAEQAKVEYFDVAFDLIFIILIAVEMFIRSRYRLIISGNEITFKYPIKYSINGSKGISIMNLKICIDDIEKIMFIPRKHRAKRNVTFAYIKLKNEMVVQANFYDFGQAAQTEILIILQALNESKVSAVQQ